MHDQSLAAMRSVDNPAFAMLLEGIRKAVREGWGRRNCPCDRRFTVAPTHAGCIAHNTFA